jgi:RNA polymerase sigma factor (TIGR02999 family)
VSEESGFPQRQEPGPCRDDHAANELFSQFYAEIRDLAEKHMRGQSANHTLQPTALVSEAYLRLLKNGQPSFNDHGHFLRAVSRAMRCALVDHARAKKAQRRLAPGVRLPLDGLVEVYGERTYDLVAFDAALERLAKIDPRGAEVVELLYFGALSETQAAEVLGVSERTIQRDWRMARAWLFRELA